MTSQYFRITAYNEQKDYSVIIDSNGKFEKLWQFSVYVRNKGLTVLELSQGENLDFGNMEEVKENPDKVFIRCYKKGKTTVQKK